MQGNLIDRPGEGFTGVKAMLRGLALGIVLAALPALTSAQSVVVEGQATIVGGDIAAARQAAIRDALGNAVRQGSVAVSNVAATHNSALVFDQVLLRASGRVRRHEVIDESRDADLIRVRIRAELEPNTDAGGKPSVCREGHVKRVLIGAFPLQRPEQVLPEELYGYSQLTAREIATRFASQPAVMVGYQGDLVLNYARPKRVVGDFPADRQAWERVRAEAEKHRAQYLLLGEFRAFELDAAREKRQLDLEVLLVDAFSGTIAARTRIAEVAIGEVVIPKAVLFGSAAHLRSGLGVAYDALLRRVAEWTEATASCLPFGTRVIRSENGRGYIDAGTEQRLAVGDSFTAFRVRGTQITTSGGEVLGQEKSAIGEARVTAVYPRFAIVDAVGGGSLETGDELHSY